MLLTPDDLLIQRSNKKLLSALPPYIHDFVFDKEENRTSMRSINSYLFRITHFFKWLIETEIVEAENIAAIPLTALNDLRKRDVTIYFSQLREEEIHVAPVSNVGATKQRELTSVAASISALKSLFVFLSEKSEDDTGNTYIDRNVMAKIAIPVQRQTANNRAAVISTKLLASEDIHKFVRWLDDPEGFAKLYEEDAHKLKYKLFLRDKERDIAMIALMLATGIRVGEVARIEMKDINYAKQTIHLLRKGNNKDTIYVMDFAFDYLKRYINVRNIRYPNAISCPFLFVTYRHPAKPITRRAIQYQVEKYTEEFFEKGVLPHTLRHSFSVAFAKNGGDLTILRDLLGHSDIQTTSLYLNMANSDKVDALKALNDTVFDPAAQ